MQPNFVDLMLDAVFLVDVRGRIAYVNAASERIFGYTPEEMIGHAIIDFVAPDDRAKTWEESMQVMSGESRIGFENRYLRKDGRLVHIMWSARWSEADQMRIGVARDITEMKHAQAVQAATYSVSEAAHRASDVFGLFLEIHSIIAKLVPVAGMVAATRDPVSKQLKLSYETNQYGESALLPQSQLQQCCENVVRTRQPMLLPEDAPESMGGNGGIVGASYSWLVLPLLSQKAAMGALVVKSTPGIRYSSQEKDLLQFVAGEVGTAMERMQLRAELQRAARYDELTGLPNRRLFNERVNSALSRCRRQHSRIAFLYVDIDKFKQVNDTLGHATGDLLLKEVARRLANCIRDEDAVARIGGDEFVVLLEEVHHADDAATVADKIRSAMREPVKAETFLLQTRVSIGIANYPEHGDNLERLLRHADDAMYFDKMRGLAVQSGADLP